MVDDGLRPIDFLPKLFLDVTWILDIRRTSTILLMLTILGVQLTQKFQNLIEILVVVWVNLRVVSGDFFETGLGERFLELVDILIFIVVAC